MNHVTFLILSCGLLAALLITKSIDSIYETRAECTQCIAFR